METLSVQEVFTHLIATTETKSGLDWIEAVAACLGESLGADLVLVASDAPAHADGVDLCVVWRSEVADGLPLHAEHIKDLRNRFVRFEQRFSGSAGSRLIDRAGGSDCAWELNFEPIYCESARRIGFLLLLFRSARPQRQLCDDMARLMARFLSPDVQRSLAQAVPSVQGCECSALLATPTVEFTPQPADGWVSTLTGLGNARYLRRRCREMVVESRSGDTQYAVIHVDIDFFKTMNAFFDRATTDKVVIAVANTLAEVCAMESGQLFHVDPDGFVAVLPNVSDRDHAAALAESMRAAVEGVRVFCKDGLMWISACVGVAVGNPAQLWHGDTLGRARFGLNTARRLGYNRVVIMPNDGSLDIDMQ